MSMLGFFRRREDEFTRSYDQYLARLDRRDEEAKKKARVIPRLVPLPEEEDHQVPTANESLQKPVLIKPQESQKPQESAPTGPPLPPQQLPPLPPHLPSKYDRDQPLPLGLLIYDDHHSVISQLEIMMEDAVAEADVDTVLTAQRSTTPNLGRLDPEQFLAETTPFLHITPVVSRTSTNEPHSPLSDSLVYLREPSPLALLEILRPPTPETQQNSSTDITTNATKAPENRRLTPLPPRLLLTKTDNQTSGDYYKTPVAEFTTPALDDVYTPHTQASDCDTPALEVSPVFTIPKDNRLLLLLRLLGGGDDATIALHLKKPPMPSLTLAQPKPLRLFDAIYNRPIVQTKTKWLEQEQSAMASAISDNDLKAKTDITTAKATTTTTTSKPTRKPPKAHHSPPLEPQLPKKVHRRKPPTSSTEDKLDDKLTSTNKNATIDDQPLTPRQQEKLRAQVEALYAISSKKHTARQASMHRLKIQLPKRKLTAARQWLFELCTIHTHDDNPLMSYENFMKLLQKYSH